MHNIFSNPNDTVTSLRTSSSMRDRICKTNYRFFSTAPREAYLHTKKMGCVIFWHFHFKLPLTSIEFRIKSQPSVRFPKKK